MQDRATFITGPLSVLVCSLTLFVSPASAASSDDQLQLPKRVTDLRTTPNDDKSSLANDPQDLAALKSAIKSEILEELKDDRDFAWKQSSKPKLNSLELAGYFRARADAFSRCDLGTFIPNVGGTSQCPPPVSYFPAEEGGARSSSSWLLSSDLRFRLDPTLNVSEDIRIKGRIDVLDNLVLGSTPEFMAGTAANPTFPIPALSHSQNSPLIGTNSQFLPLAVKRLWGEVSFPFGEFRFGRMPLSWGLGILYNAGDELSQDFGNNVDGLFFTTRVFGHDLTPGFTVSYVGPTGRGSGIAPNSRWLPAEGSQRLDLEPSDNVYNLHLSFARKDSATELQALLDDNRFVWNYGVMGTYRFQISDSLFVAPADSSFATLRAAQFLRNAHLGLASLWSKMQVGTLHIELEAAGIFGQIGNGRGLWNDVPGNLRTDPIWVYQGGVAVESRYGFLQNRLQVGLDGGWASGDPAPGFGIRPGLNGAEQVGGDDNAITNFRFDRDYRVDMLLFREVLGTVSDALYLKPHVAYFFTDNFGIRGDVVGSMSNFVRSTPGNNQFLGLELDASVFFKTDDGFVLNFQYGYLFPFDGLNHDKAGPLINNNEITYADFGKAQSASALRLTAGILF